MKRPLLYAFGGLPVLLLAVLLGLGLRQRPVEPAVPAVAGSEDVAIAPKPEAALPPIPRAKPPREQAAVDAPPPKSEAPAGDDAATPQDQSAAVDSPVKNETPVPDDAASAPPKPDWKAPTDEPAGVAEKPRPSGDVDSVPSTAGPDVADRIGLETIEPPPVAESPDAATPPVFGGEGLEATANLPALEPDARGGRLVVIPGNTLWRLSEVIYGKGRDYMVLVRANPGIVGDPDLILPGQIIVVPGADPPLVIDPRRKRPLRRGERGPSVAR